MTCNVHNASCPKLNCVHLLTFESHIRPVGTGLIDRVSEVPVQYHALNCDKLMTCVFFVCVFFIEQLHYRPRSMRRRIKTMRGIKRPTTNKKMIGVTELIGRTINIL